MRREVIQAQFTLCLLLGALLCGCVPYFNLAPNKSAVLTEPAYTLDDYRHDLTNYECVVTNPVARTALRNKLIYSIASEIDKEYNRFKSGFFALHSATETTLDVSQIGLGIAGTFAGGETSQLLSAISGGVTGSRASFNKNYLKEKTPELILARTDALRTEQWTVISHKLDKDDATYSFYEAKIDLIAYYEKGTFQSAFQSINAESGVAQKAAETEQKAAVAKKYGEFIGTTASADELVEVKTHYAKFQAITDATNKTNRATTIVTAYTKLNDQTLKNQTNATAVEQVMYLYSIARQKGQDQVRADLISAFKIAQ